VCIRSENAARMLLSILQSRIVGILDQITRLACKSAMTIAKRNCNGVDEEELRDARGHWRDGRVGSAAASAF
jgi:hypothetical protein